jgi:5-methyltetrahydrofolate--homocysteine methyltransferase
VKFGVRPRAKIVIGTVKGDLHDIGKNLVAMMFRGAGFEVNDVGIDVSPQKFVEAVKKIRPHLLAMSALLSTSLDYMRVTILKLQEEKLNVKTIVGGAPVTEDYARAINAGGYAPDAASAVDKAKELLKIK